MSTTMRIPKWLLEEMFTIYYHPKRKRGRFQVFVRNDPNQPGLGSTCGFGHSIADAAKSARLTREAEKK